MSDESLYSRQSSLELLKYEYAVVVGLGGIGNWVALDLALSGRVKNMILIDGDTVDHHNMNRTIFRYCDIGQYKVDAVRFQILERRADLEVTVYRQITDDKLVADISKMIVPDPSCYSPKSLVMDCRDDIYDDLLDINCKLYKVGYDGTSMTIDGNPRLTKVFTQRGGSYSVVPSYIGSSQIVAAIAVNDALGAGTITNNYISEILSRPVCENPFIRSNFDNGRDEYGRLNCNVTFRCENIIPNCCPTQVKSYNIESVIDTLDKQREEEISNEQ